MGARTLAEMPEEHVKEGDVDGAVGSSVVFDLAQHHLQPRHWREGVWGGGRDTETHVEKESRGNRTLNPFLPKFWQNRTMWGKGWGTSALDLLLLMPNRDMH